MSGFIRPELRRNLRRWAEPLGTGLVAVLGLYFLWRGYARYNQVLEALGLVLLLAGSGLFWAAVRRAQFNRPGDGAGLVEVTERRVSYMTATGGESVDLEAMTRLEIRNSIEFGRVWVLKQSEGATLFIPLAAAGSEALFDAFSALPGMDVAKLVHAVNADSDQRDVIWRGSPGFRALT